MTGLNKAEATLAAIGGTITGPAQYLFHVRADQQVEDIVQDPSVWQSIDVPLVSMSVDHIEALMNKLDIASERVQPMVARMRAANLGGLVLATCDLEAVRETLKASLRNSPIIFIPDSAESRRLDSLASANRDVARLPTD
jgi:hypothetical protein